MSQSLSRNASNPAMPKRVFFLNRTSDILGSFTKTDLDSYSDLIRRKVQERCATTQDLMSTIRRIKTGEAGYVTPNEFRFTLIKLGITLPQPVVNDLFNRFDSDGSGTMDFDEFAMWIMNSEFRPEENNAPVVRREPPDMRLRAKFSAFFKENPSYCNGIKTQYTFLELVSELSRKAIRSVNERDVRSMFLIMDKRKTNSVDMRSVKRWAETGNSDTPPASAKPLVVPNLKDALIKVCGSTPEYILNGFEYARGQKNVHFDEFRRSLLACGLGQRPDDVKNLFIALGGAGGNADIDKLLDAASSLPIGSPAHAGGRTVHAFSVPSRADRKLRQGIRRTYEQLRRALELADRTQSGYVSTDAFLAIIQKHCMQTSVQDFRYIMSKVQTHPSNSDKYDWRHFLEIYNPLQAPHELMGGATAKPQAPRMTPHLESGKNRSALSSRGSGVPEDYAAPNGAGPSALHDIKKIWINILRSCQRADPNKSGFVGRTQFVTALEKNLHQVCNSQYIFLLYKVFVNNKSCFIM